MRNYSYGRKDVTIRTSSRNWQRLRSSEGFTGVYKAFSPRPPPCVNWCKFPKSGVNFLQKSAQFKKKPVSLINSTNQKNSENNNAEF